MTSVGQRPSVDIVEAVLEQLDRPKHRVLLQGYKRLVAVYSGTGYAVVNDGPDACVLTENVCEQLCDEARHFGVRAVVAVSRCNLDL